MDLDKCIENLKAGQLLKEVELYEVCEKAKEILFEESNVQPVNGPVIVCGDIHGQFFDLLELFRIGGDITKNNYIFIGDFVDRGYHSIETFSFLLCLKVRYPHKITLLRGNHESRQITSVYGFYEEIIRKYGHSLPWKVFTEVFDYLPLGALVEGSVLCIHGGLSPELKTLDQIRLIDRKMEIPHAGPYSDIMWSDPEDIKGWQASTRGAGYLFGSEPTNDFCRINGLDLICRAHQLVQEGYKYWFDNQNLVTVWSAPNYCYRCGNVAAIVEIKENLERDFRIFNAVPESGKSVHPKNVLPYFM